jgi:hypothetical protein
MVSFGSTPCTFADRAARSTVGCIALHSEAESNYKPAPGPAEYLAFLTANGYPLSAIEQVLVGQRDSEGVYSSPDPITRSRSMLDTSTSFGPASALTRVPMCTAIPPSPSSPGLRAGPRDHRPEIE